MFCIKCGKQIVDTAQFCPFCGNSISNGKSTCDKPVTYDKPQPTPIPTLDVPKNTSYKPSSTTNSSSGIGVAFIIIGVICGILALFFAIGEGDIFGYSSWDYEYGGARTVNIYIGLAAVFSLVIGIVMTANSSNK